MHSAFLAKKMRFSIHSVHLGATFNKLLTSVCSVNSASYPQQNRNNFLKKYLPTSYGAKA